MTEQIKANGIDISEASGPIVFCADSYDFAIIRVGYGWHDTQIDRRFEANYEAAVVAGLKVGVFHYSYAATPNEARMEAETCLTWLGGRALDLPVYYAIEDDRQYGLGRIKCTELCETFCATILSAGYEAGVRASEDWLLRRLDRDKLSSRYSIWVVTSGVPTSVIPCDIWKYGVAKQGLGLNKAFIGSAAADRINGADDSASQEEKERVQVPVGSGTQIKLTDAPIYSTATSNKIINSVNGCYWLYDSKLSNGRYRVTDNPEKVGAKPIKNNILGFVSEEDIVTR